MKKGFDAPITLTIEVSPPEVDAGADVTVTVAAKGPPQWDLAGETVSIEDAAGTVLRRVELARAEPGDDDDFDEDDDDGDDDDDDDDEDDDDDDDEDDDDRVVTGTVFIAAPAVAGSHVLRAVLPALGDDEDGRSAVSAETRVVVQAHAATVSAWDISAATAAGERVAVTVGVKCSCGCNLAGRPYRLLDQDGREVAAGALRAEVWPKTTALYYDQTAAVVALEPGTYVWTVMTAAGRRRSQSVQPRGLSVSRQPSVNPRSASFST